MKFVSVPVIITYIKEQDPYLPFLQNDANPDCFILSLICLLSRACLSTWVPVTERTTLGQPENPFWSCQVRLLEYSFFMCFKYRLSSNLLSAGVIWNSTKSLLIFAVYGYSYYLHFTEDISQADSLSALQPFHFIILVFCYIHCEITNIIYYLSCRRRVGRKQLSADPVRAPARSATGGRRPADGWLSPASAQHLPAHTGSV